VDALCASPNGGEFCRFAVMVTVSRVIKVRVSLKVWSVVSVRIRVRFEMPVEMPVAECIYIYIYIHIYI